MPLSSAALAEKRRRAREAGLCITCCLRRPRERRVVCRPCAENINRSKARKRARLRQHADIQHIIVAQEAAGDRAIEYHLYEDGVSYYQDALKIQAISESGRVRISEKLGEAYLLSGKPTEAAPWFDRVLMSHPVSSEHAEKNVELLLRTAHQIWINAKTEEALPVITQAVKMAERTGSSQPWKVANITMACILTTLGRLSEATQYLDRVGQVSCDDAIAIRTNYYWQRGSVAARFGQEKQAYEYLERAISYAKEDTDLYRVVSVFGDSALYAMALGNIERAKNYCQQALLIARQNHLGWLIPVMCLGYARILMRMGQYSLAHEYVIEALAIKADTPLLDERFVAVGIPLALQVHDESMLRQCVRVEEIERVFQAGDPSTIGGVTAAFACFFVSRNQESKARALLHRAIGVVRSIELCPDFPLQVAQYGAKADCLKVRAILEERVRLPSAGVAEASLLLFDAFVDRRSGRMTRVHNGAAAAVERFDALKWHGYADLARTLLPDPMKARHVIKIDGRPFSETLPELTLREQQVAELVLKGITNRKIADALSIKERTVEAHMTSIMGHLGVRSRHQLVSVIDKVVP